MEVPTGPTRAPWRGPAAIGAVALLALLPGLGPATRLTYHEAIVAQSARELLAGGSVLVPTLDGRPWLEKPPLMIWLVAGLGALVGQVDETVARAPAALSAVALCLAVATLARRRTNPTLGLLAGAVQGTMVWTVARGRLAEPDVLLAALVAWTLVAFDALRDAPDRARWRWAFFALLGSLGLVKGVGFGAAVVMSVVVPVLVWERDRPTARRLATCWGGWAIALAISLAWPIAVGTRHPEVWGLWVEHVVGRYARRPGGFAGEPWWEYASAPLVFLLPWTPLALAGAWRGGRRLRQPSATLDRLLCVWAVGPALLVSLAQARNAHYLLPALAPWSIWTAQSLARFGERLTTWGWDLPSRRQLAHAGFLGTALALGLGFATIGPRLDWRGPEWAFYEQAARLVPADEPLVLLYDDWDKRPYPTPFGPMPFDLPVRLFYLDRPVAWRGSPNALLERPPETSGPFAVIGRARDLPNLRVLGQIEPLAQGPRLREPASKVEDRAFVLVRVRPPSAILTVPLNIRVGARR